jgi:hypothetical protein
MSAATAISAIALSATGKRVKGSEGFITLKRLLTLLTGNKKVLPGKPGNTFGH